FLCQNCYSEVSLISYPERYETLRREFIKTKEARKLAWLSFRIRFEYRSKGGGLIPFAWASLPLAFINYALLIVPIALLIIGYSKNLTRKKKMAEWIDRKKRWEESNPAPLEPTLKHFHDPMAELTQRDRQILRIFDHWPGYPPYWDYLRSVVTSSDSNRCQVTGCPSRLSLHVHHVRPVAQGGAHSPDNLVSLCKFHHALEPTDGHERIWGNIKNEYFTLVHDHERNNRASDGTHHVRAHLRRLELITREELVELAQTYGFCCPNCADKRIDFIVHKNRNLIRVECTACEEATEGPQQLAEESGPHLAEILGITRNKGRWKARWDTLSERRSAKWGTWNAHMAHAQRQRHRKKIEMRKSASICQKCGSKMRLVKPRPTDKWKAFWGCSAFPKCTGNAKYVPSRY
ncbi:MAG TPA: HNH endonuclease, partial [Rhabdochlamydiaceae bacterium]